MGNLCKDRKQDKKIEKWRHFLSRPLLRFAQVRNPVTCDHGIAGLDRVCAVIGWIVLTRLASERCAQKQSKRLFDGMHAVAWVDTFDESKMT